LRGGSKSGEFTFGVTRAAKKEVRFDYRNHYPYTDQHANFGKVVSHLKTWGGVVKRPTHAHNQKTQSGERTTGLGHFKRQETLVCRPSKTPDGTFKKCAARRWNRKVCKEKKKWGGTRH